MGILFSLDRVVNQWETVPNEFSSPCLGILFSLLHGDAQRGNPGAVFVPMFGDSFFTRKSAATEVAELKKFSSPCLGILFSHE